MNGEISNVLGVYPVDFGSHSGSCGSWMNWHRARMHGSDKCDAVGQGKVDGRIKQECKMAVCSAASCRFDGAGIGIKLTFQNLKCRVVRASSDDR